MLSTSDEVLSAVGVYSYAEGANPNSHPFIVARVNNGKSPEDSDRSLYGTVLVGTYAYRRDPGTILFTVHKTFRLYDTPYAIAASEVFGGAPFPPPSGFNQWALFVIPERAKWTFNVDYYPAP